MIRILICDDQILVCEGLKAILSTVPDFEVVGITTNGAEAIDAIPTLLPDLVLMDLKMPNVNGVQATRQIKQRYPNVQVLVLTTYDADEWVFEAIRSGAAGYLLKGSPKETLVTAIRGTIAGQTHVDPAVAGKLFSHIAGGAAPSPDPSFVSQFSDRELEVLNLLGQGFSNAEISRTLYLSEGTVRNYMSSILNKLGVSDRTQAAILAVRHGLVHGMPKE